MDVGSKVKYIDRELSAVGVIVEKYWASHYDGMVCDDNSRNEWYGKIDFGNSDLLGTRYIRCALYEKNHSWRVEEMSLVKKRITKHKLW